VNRPIYWWAPEDAPYKITYMPEYEKINEPNELAKNLLVINVETSLFLFKIVFFISPFAFIYFTVLYVLQINKKKKSKNIFLYQLLIVLFGTSFLHVLLHAITGAIIDRYAFVAYPIALLAMILLFKLKEYKVK
jgi:ammonia channel protein AmtB